MTEALAYLPADYTTGTLVLVGLTPLLMNNDAHVVTGGRPARITPAKEAERACYWTADRASLCLRAKHLLGALCTAARGSRLPDGRLLAPVIAAGVRFAPKELPLGTTAYEVDVQPVVVRGDYSGARTMRIPRVRARVFPWQVQCIVFADPLLTPAFLRTTFRALLERAGHAVGLLDYGPRKGGDFGRFRVERWHLGEVRCGGD